MCSRAPIHVPGDCPIGPIPAGLAEPSPDDTQPSSSMPAAEAVDDPDTVKRVAARLRARAAIERKHRYTHAAEVLEDEAAMLDPEGA